MAKEDVNIWRGKIDNHFKMDNRTKGKGEKSYSMEMEKKREKEDSSQIIINKSIYFLRKFFFGNVGGSEWLKCA